MIMRAMRWPGLRLGLAFIAAAGLLISAVAMVPTAAADDGANSEAPAFSSLYIEPISVTGGIMLATQGLVRAFVVATKDAQGAVTIECREQPISAEDSSQ